MAEVLDDVRKALRDKARAELEAMPRASDWADFRRRCGRHQAFLEAEATLVDTVQRYMHGDEDDDED